MKNRVQVLLRSLTLLSAALLSKKATGVSFQYTYRNAKCVDEFTIRGIINLAWDDFECASSFEYRTEYYGGCLHLVDGPMNLDTYRSLHADAANSSEEDFYLTDNMKNYYDHGICMECSGVVGCSADGTCANFKSYPVSATNRISSSLIQMPDSVNEVAKMVEVSSRTIIQDNNALPSVL